MEGAPGIRLRELSEDDLFVRDGRLHFPALGRELDKDTGLARAKKLLEIARSEAESRMTFGGRVLQAGIDPSASLRNYYTVLRLAKLLAEEGELAGAVESFLPNISVPSDLVPLVEKSIGSIQGAVKAEPALALGTMTAANVQQLVSAAQQGQHAALAIDDQTLRAHLPNGWWANLQQALESGAPNLETKIAQVRLFARSAELGLNGPHGRQVGEWNTVAAALPNDDVSASILLRLAAANGFDPSELQFYGEPLSARGKKKPAAGITGKRRAAGRAEPAAPVAAFGSSGVTSISARSVLRTKELGRKVQDVTTFGQLASTNDPSAFEISDAGIHALRTAYASPYHWPYTGQASVEYERGAMRLFERSVELGVYDTTYLQHYVQSRLVGSNVDDKEVMGGVARLVLHANVMSAVPSWTLPNGVRLDQNAAFNEGVVRAQRRLNAETAPLPIRSTSGEYTIETGPAGSYTGDYNALYSARDPRFLELADSNFQGLEHVGNPVSWMGQFGVGAIRLCARITELYPQALSQAHQFLASVPANAQIEEAIPHLARLATAAKVPFEQVYFQSGSPATLAQHPALARLRKPAVPTSAQAKRVKQLLAALDPAKSVQPRARRDALLALVSTGEGSANLEIRDLFAKAVEQRKRGTLAPLSMTGFNEDAQVALARDVLASIDHAVAAAIILGLYTKIPSARIARALEEDGYGEALAGRWSKMAEQLQPLDGRDLEFVLSDVLKEEPSFHSLELKLELASNRLTATDLEQAFERMKETDPIGFIEGILSRAAQTSVGSAERNAVRRFIDEKIEARELDLEEVRDLLGADTISVLAPDAEAGVEQAVAAYLRKQPMERKEALPSIVEAIKRGGRFASGSALAERALDRLYQADLTNVLPLGQADEELGGVGPARFDAERPFAEGVETVTVAGIDLKVNDRPDKDRRAIPRASNAELVMTETTQRNLRLMAAAWRKRKPVLLEGPTSSGKTSAVRYLAYKTGSPYRRINLSYYTDVSDLLGKYVGGERRYDRAKLEEKSDGALRAIAREYGIEEEARDEIVRSVLAAQEKPRWVDGPVIKAMKNGEVLLLDEMNLARPEVLERLNSLFDDDGNVVLTEHHNEVIVPDESFRLFATMNPASYSGRARLSDAMRSRWNPVFAHGLKQADLTQILKATYGEKLPVEEMAKLVAVHDALSRSADEMELGRASGGVAFTLRNLFRVADRFVRYRGGELDDAALMRRETTEIYAGGLFEPEDLQHVDDVLKAAMPYSGPGFYEGLELVEHAEHFEIGDVKIRKLALENPHVPGESSRLVMTKRTKQIFYRLAKALDMGENVAMMGERASGKTAIAKMFAMLRGQPYHRQLLSGSTDAMQLVGGYDDTGWKDGLLLGCGRPDAAPGVFLGDELNLASPALLERLNSVLDDERKLVLAEKEGEEIRLHPEFRFIAAMNPPTKEYGGRNKLSKAMQNRFTMLWVSSLDEAEEQKEICAAVGKKLGVPEAITNTLVDLQKWITGSYENESLGKEIRDRDRPVYSIRQLLSAISLIAEFQKEMGPAMAYLLAAEVTYAASPQLTDNTAILEKARELAA
jgi:MoxR-like ATPase